MQFFHNTTLDMLLKDGADVVAVDSNGTTCTQVPMCRIFLNNGQPFIDFNHATPGVQIAPIPPDAVVSRNEQELSVGRFVVVVGSHTDVGRMIHAYTKH